MKEQKLHSTRPNLLKASFALLQAVLLAVPLSLCLQAPIITKADKVTDLTNQKTELELKAKRAEQAALEQKTVAERAAAKIVQLTSQIGNLQDNIETTAANIDDTTTNINQQTQTIAQLESELRRVKDQQDALVRQMYIMKESAPDAILYFSNEPLSKREERQAQMSALKKSIAAIMLKTETAKTEVETQRTALVKRNDDLAALKAQQDEQKRGLADFRYTQASLKDDAQTAELALEQQAKTARADADKVEEKIRAELAARKANAQGVFGKGPGVGVRVKRGDYVGVQGSTGFSTGDHVHFETDLNGPANSYTSPWPYINNGTLSWPLKSFEITQDYWESNGWYAGGHHMGIDIAGPIGSPVFAPADGLVVLNEWFGGYGNAWSMKVDNGPYVLLGHLRR